MSAIFACVIWNEPIGWPNALRSFTNWIVASYAARERPTACDAMPMRPASSTPIAILKPSPSSPMRFSTGQLVVGQLDLARRRRADAELRLGLAAMEALLLGVDQEAGDALRALRRARVIANSITYFATGPEVIQLFLPLIT